MKRSADTDQRQLRWSLGCAHPELAGVQLDMPVVGLGDSLVVRATYLYNRFASRGSAFV